MGRFGCDEVVALFGVFGAVREAFASHEHLRCFVGLDHHCGLFLGGGWRGDGLVREWCDKSVVRLYKKDLGAVGVTYDGKVDFGKLLVVPSAHMSSRVDDLRCRGLKFILCPGFGGGFSLFQDGVGGIVGVRLFQFVKGSGSFHDGGFGAKKLPKLLGFEDPGLLDFLVGEVGRLGRFYLDKDFYLRTSVSDEVRCLKVRNKKLRELARRERGI